MVIGFVDQRYYGATKSDISLPSATKRRVWMKRLKRSHMGGAKRGKLGQSGCASFFTVKMKKKKK